MYKGTNGLWNIIISDRPDDNIITEDDKAIYEEIMVNTNAMKREGDSLRPKASKSHKLNTLNLSGRSIKLLRRGRD
jgi:hypothetical protein